ncbi:MAG TPA: FAD-dependent oxidoreductase [Gemmatimonadaceae bacterium]|nr:FAD-dependent oxidoreductase [Gemmatimonadaceae bacterium]
MRSSADVVICGAGIAGAAAAYHLAARSAVRRVVLLDEREPLTLTSDKGTQGYRNWWPGPDDTMLRLVSRSIDLLEEVAGECGNAFRMNRRGYLFATADAEQAARLGTAAKEVSSFGMGPVRQHPGAASYLPAPAEGYGDQPVGADLLLGDEARRAFPYLATDMSAALHVRRAGWVNAVALGSWLIKRAIGAGATVVRDRLAGVPTDGGRIGEIRLESGDVINTDRLLIAAGPALGDVAGMLGVTLPVFHELHAKLTMRDPRGAVPRGAPFLIWSDPVRLEWSDAERAELARHEETRRFSETLPGGVHIRPVDLEHGDELYLIWTYETDERPYVWPPTFNARYADVVLRGSARMVPALAPYVGTDAAANGTVDGGYYCKTRENRPLVGPLPVEGAFVLGALSGSGVMASLGAAELAAAHVAGRTLPAHARWFLPSRYDDPAYRALVERWGPLVGQL